MSINAMEDYKAKYAIHEACREGQSTCMILLTLYMRANSGTTRTNTA